MKLYVNDKQTGERVYLNLTAPSRNELINKIGSHWFTINGQNFSVQEVYAENTDGDNTTSGTVVGGLVGILGGPLGIFLGGLLGGAIGNSSDNSEKERVKLFNNSILP